MESLPFTKLLPNWIYLIFQQAQEGRKADIFTCTVWKIRLEELKEADACPRSTSLLGWGENLVLLTLNLVFPGFKVLKRLRIGQSTFESKVLLKVSHRVGKRGQSQV